MIYAKNFARNYEKNNTRKIRRLVDEMIIPSTKHIILKIVRLRNSSTLLTINVYLNGRKSLIKNILSSSYYLCDQWIRGPHGQAQS